MAGLASRFRVPTSGGSKIAALKLAVNIGKTLLQLVDQSVKLFPSQPFGFQLAHLTQNLGQAPRRGGVRIKILGAAGRAWASAEGQAVFPKEPSRVPATLL